jgi:hypothetical protein
MGKFKAVLHACLRQRLIVCSLDDYLAPPSAIKLTDGEGGEGCVYVYDAETSKQFLFPPSFRPSARLSVCRSKRISG